MRRIKEVLRLYFEQRQSRRLIAQTIGVSPTTVSDYIQRAQVAGIGYPLPPDMGDDDLDRLFIPQPPPVTLKRFKPDWPAGLLRDTHQGHDTHARLAGIQECNDEMTGVTGVSTFHNSQRRYN